jgi:hypothetical protein
MSNFTRVESSIKDHYFRQTIYTEKYGDVTFTVTPSQLYNAREYAVQLLRHTGKYMIPPKQPVWCNIVQDLIDNANEEIEREDATPLDFIRSSIIKIIDDMKGHEYNAKEEFAKERPIIDKGDLIIKAQHIVDVLKFEQRITIKQAVNYLRNMGFESINYGEKRLKAWKINYEQFKSGGS